MMCAKKERKKKSKTRYESYRFKCGDFILQRCNLKSKKITSSQSGTEVEMT